MAHSGIYTATATEFLSRDDAQAFLARGLPLATAANPIYIAKADKAQTQWLTKSIRFADGPAGRGIEVTMDEEFTELRAGVRTAGTHQASFWLGDVGISVRTDDSTLTPSGDSAVAVLFTCDAPQCVRASWNGAQSSADWTDISIQDAAVRGRILAAFEFLKAAGGARKPPS